METLLAVVVFLITVAFMLLYWKYIMKVKENKLLTLNIEKMYKSGLDAHERAVEASATISRIVKIVPIENRMAILIEIAKSADNLHGSQK